MKRKRNYENEDDITVRVCFDRINQLCCEMVVCEEAEEPGKSETHVGEQEEYEEG